MSYPSLLPYVFFFLSQISGSLLTKKALTCVEHGQMLAKLGQALSSVVEIMRSQAADSYESHIALRTLRIIVMMERLSPSRPVKWALE
mgnify:CR=1 FL=1|jgi:hypothetical protein|tara:strand:+ start:143 stop:406 length:264 start_codon:yes stop_codon:yes gene_type:complete